MIYPIVAYGDPILRKVCDFIDKDHPDLNKIIEDMFKTMYHSQGVGLAAPQIGLVIRLFIVDTSPFSEDDPTCDGFKKVFINAEMLEESGEQKKFNEGCLSIPGIREDVNRKSGIVLRYQDINFDTHTEEYTGIRARVIQHEYDHIEGKLMIDYMTPLKKSLMKGKLNDISKGKVDVDYRMRFPKSR
jgi:peptide deformylase